MTTALPLSRQPAPPSRELLSGLHRRTGEAVHRMLTAFVADIPFYRTLPEEQLNGEVAQVCRDNLQDFARCARDERLPSSSELRAAREGAARRAEEGVPLDALLLAYTTGNRVTWEMLAEQVPPADHAVVTAFTPYLQRYLQAMVQAVTQAYVDERRAIEHDAGSAWRTLVQDLLEGRDARTLAERLGVVVADSYLVLGVHVADSPDEVAPGVDPAVAGRRKVRRVLAVVDSLPGQARSLASLTPSGGVVLLPAVGQRMPGRGETARTVEQLSAAAGAPVTAVAVTARRLKDLPSAAELALRLVQLARTLSRAPGTYLLDDLALEHQMATDGPARRHLASRVRPLADVPDLLPTLRCWLECDRNRRESAEQLHVHPNTLDKRLERIEHLTGIDVSTSRGVAVLQAALVAHEVESAARPRLITG